MFKSCESELMELMRQIDLMMHSRKAEWEAQRQTLHAKLEVREQEANVQNAILEKKTQEVCTCTYFCPTSLGIGRRSNRSTVSNLCQATRMTPNFTCWTKMLIYKLFQCKYDNLIILASPPRQLTWKRTCPPLKITLHNTV